MVTMQQRQPAWEVTQPHNTTTGWFAKANGNENLQVYDNIRQVRANTLNKPKSASGNRSIAGK
jgi:hypothetical protein